MMNEHIWNDIVGDYTEDFDDGICITYVDGYLGSCDGECGETGKIIAKIFKYENGKVSVEYIDGRARTNHYAQEVISCIIDESIE